MIGLSGLKNDMKIIDEDGNVYAVEDVRDDPTNKDRKFYTTTESTASIDAKDMLDCAMESEYNNMYEGWYENIMEDITNEDVGKIQVILDDIFGRNVEQNAIYYRSEEIDMYS